MINFNLVVYQLFSDFTIPRPERSSPAVTVNNYGEGKAYYVGARIDEAGMDNLITSILEEKGVYQLFSDFTIPRPERSASIFICRICKQRAV